MDYSDLDNALGDVAGGNDQQQEPRDEGSRDYEELEDGRFVVSRKAYETMKQSVNAKDTYTRDIQQVQMAKSALEAQVAEIQRAFQDGRLTYKEAQKAEQKAESNLDKVENGSIPKEVMQMLQQVPQMREQLELMKIEKEMIDLQKSHNLNQTAAEEVAGFAAKFTRESGYPISLDKAFYMMHGESLEKNLSAVQKQDQERKAKWAGSNQNPGYGNKQRKPITSLEEAGAMSVKILEQEMR